jgi:hypothetical protein
VLICFSTGARAGFVNNFQEGAETRPPQGDSLRKDTIKVTKPQRKNQLNSKVVYNAKDSILFNVPGQKVYLYGDAEITYENINLKAAFIEIDWESQILFAKGLPDSAGKLNGQPVFSENNQKFRSEEVRYNFRTKKGKISNIITQEGDGYIHGSTVKKDQENNFYIQQGAYTTCNLDTPHFFIATEKLKVIQNNKIVTGPAYLVVENVPTPFVIPFGLFPNKKGQASGILIPSIGESAQYGFALENGGYYFGLSDYMNLELRANLYSKGSYNFRTLSRYNRRYRYNGDVSLDYTVFKEGTEGTPDYSRSNNFFVRWNHSQDPKANPNARFTANVNAGSSKFFRNTLNTAATDYLSNTFSSSISYSRYWPGKPYNFSANMRHSQNTEQKTVELTLPDLLFSVNRFYPFKKAEQVGTPAWYEKIGISYTNSFQNVIRTYDSLLFTPQTFRIMQNGMRHSVPIATSFNVGKFFSLTPSVNYQERWYLRTFEHRWDPAAKRVARDTIDRFAMARSFDFSTSLSTRLFGIAQFKKSKIQAIRHVVTPTLSFTARPDFSSPFWNYYQEVQKDDKGNTGKYSRFEGTIYGSPPAGKAASLGFGLDNNIEMKVRTDSDTGSAVKKIKIFESISVFSGYNFIADSLKLQPFSIAGRTVLIDRINITLSGTVNPYLPDSGGGPVNRFEWKENRRIGRLTNASLFVSFNFNSAARDRSPVRTTPENTAEIENIKRHPEEYVDFSIPWNLSASYNLNYSNSFNLRSADPQKQVTQAITFSGDLNLTPQWKVGFSSGYDFKNEEFTYTSLNIYRDLHCWEMRLNWIPFGFRQSYNFQINVKSSVLQDLKLLKRNPPSIR